MPYSAENMILYEILLLRSISYFCLHEELSQILRKKRYIKSKNKVLLPPRESADKRKAHGDKNADVNQRMIKHRLQIIPSIKIYLCWVEGARSSTSTRSWHECDRARGGRGALDPGCGCTSGWEGRRDDGMNAHVWNQWAVRTDCLSAEPALNSWKITIASPFHGRSFLPAEREGQKFLRLTSKHSGNKRWHRLGGNFQAKCGRMQGHVLKITYTLKKKNNRFTEKHMHGA